MAAKKAGGKKKMYTIIYDRDGCTGAGACVTAASDNWQMGADNKANLLKKKISEDELERNLAAAKACPVNVIHIEDENGKRLI